MFEFTFDSIARFLGYPSEEWLRADYHHVNAIIDGAIEVSKSDELLATHMVLSLKEMVRCR